jgi:alkanesulfonate monooxygenase SsuD/methylene tetrahydromethanopterin reductase-like flavin-dependent oxidoreductase (luciferase family)
MADYGHDLQFGVFLTPAAAEAGRVLELAQLAEREGLDLVTVQDHPYQPRFLDAWTLLSFVAARTSAIHVAPNVANLPLRLPAVLARSVASLDVLSGGRVELGLGAGAFWDAIEANGGPRRTPGESVTALSEAIDIIRALWAAGGAPVRIEGRHYRVSSAKPGPPPAHRVGIWLGAYKPRMLALTGAKADGWLPSMGYANPDTLGPLNAAIDEAAVAAGRSPSEIRRIYNIFGGFDPGAGFLQGPPADWAQQLTQLSLTEGIATYILGVDNADDLQRFAAEVAPAVREQVDAERSS